MWNAIIGADVLDSMATPFDKWFASQQSKGNIRFQPADEGPYGYYQAGPANDYWDALSTNPYAGDGSKYIGTYLPQWYDQRNPVDSQGRRAWGSELYDYSSSAGAGETGSFANALPTVTLDGEQWHRVGEDVSDPAWMQRFLESTKPDAKHYASQWDMSKAARYDPTYGYLMRDPEYQEAMRLRIANKPTGFFTEEAGPWSAFSKTIGPVMGIGSALSSLSSLGVTGAGEILAGAAYEGIPYQSLGSSLAANAASQGGSLMDIGNALGITTPTALPDISKSAGFIDQVPDTSTGFTFDEAGNVIEDATLPQVDVVDTAIPADKLSPLPGPSTTPDASLADKIAAVKAAADPIEAMYKATTITGTDTMTDAAKALGYTGTYDLLNSVNPAWLTAGGAAAAALQKLGLNSAADALTSGSSGAVDSISKALGGITAKDLLTAGAAVGGSLLTSGAAKDAADIQAQSAKDAIALQRYMFDTTRGDLMPWLDQGKIALSRVGEMLGISGDPRSAGYGSLMRNFGASDLEADPVYGASKDFQLGETRRMLTNAASARGETDSGVLMKNLLQYGTGILTAEGGNAFNRYNANRTSAYNMIAPTANLGQTTGISLGNIGQTAGQVIGNNITGAGNAQAAGVVGSANALNSGISTALKSYFDNELLRRFMPSATATTSPYGGSYGAFAE